MKRVIKSKTLLFILIALVSLTSVVLAYSYTADEIGFSPTDTNWNVEKVDDALDSLRNTVSDYTSISIPLSYETYSNSFNLRSIGSVNFSSYKSKYKYISLVSTWSNGNCNSYLALFYDSGWSISITPELKKKYLMSEYPIFYQYIISKNTSNSCVMTYNVMLSN